ncbi:MAG: M48 family metalloprotease [Deltaproteobacteria bacterium]|nr:M48 family metalloprotease [Deltaproteobacteria bacterium]
MSDPTTVTVTCRFCGSANRLPVERALQDLKKVVCGSCKSGLLRVNGEPLTDLSPADIMHPMDREALDKLKAIPLLDTVVGKVLGSTFDKLRRFEHLASAIRVSDRQVPRLWRLYLEAAGRLDVDPPPLFLMQSPVPNAYTVGAQSPLVCITTALVDALDDRSLVGVLGHELTHVRLGHVLYRTVAELLANGVLMLSGMFGLGNLALGPIKVVLFKWYQMSELSGDRGELIASGSLETHIRTHMMLAGGSAKLQAELDVAAFIDQAHEADLAKESDLFVNLMETLGGARRSHPLNVWRVHHALGWARSQAFFDLLAGKYKGALPRE